MKYKTFEERLEHLNRRYAQHLQDMTVTANKINGKSFLLLKNKENKVIECIILSDETPNYEKVETFQ